MKRNFIPLLALTALTLAPFAHAEGEVLGRNQQAAGRGNTADNSRLDTRTGEKVLPDTVSSSNPGNPDAPMAPGGMGQVRHERPEWRGVGVAGAIGNLNLPASGNTPWDQLERSTAVAVEFQKGSASLTPDAKQAIDTLIVGAQMQNAGVAVPNPQQKVEAAKVVAWGDTATTAVKKSLPKEEQKLAKERDETLSAYVRTKLSDVSVTSYNMAQKPGIISRLFNKNETQIRQRFASLTGDAPADSSQASRAYVMLIMKR